MFPVVRVMPLLKNSHFFSHHPLFGKLSQIFNSLKKETGLHNAIEMQCATYNAADCLGDSTLI